MVSCEAASPEADEGTEKTGVFRPLAEEETDILVGDFSAPFAPLPVPELEGVAARLLFAVGHWFIERESFELGCGEKAALEFDPELG